MSIKNHKGLDIFITEMINILKTKEIIYKNSWKSVNINFLQDLLNEQVHTLIPTNSERSKRKLVHIANYCYLLYTRLDNQEVLDFS